jgi:hypothetical protein
MGCLCLLYCRPWDFLYGASDNEEEFEKGYKNEELIEKN